MPFQKTTHANYFYEIFGEGETPIVLISGYTCDHTHYYSILEALQPHFKILVFDNLGIGQTTDDYETLDSELMADDLLELTEAIGFKKPIIVGHSMGGTIAQAFATRHPDKLSKLILLTTTAKWRHSMLHFTHTFLAMREQEADFDTLLTALTAWTFGEVFLSKPENLATFKEILLNQEHPQSLENQSRQCHVLDSFDGRDELSSITVETLIAFGREDLLTLPEESHYLHEHIKGSQLVEFECGHVLTAEAAELLASEIISFAQN